MSNETEQRKTYHTVAYNRLELTDQELNEYTNGLERLLAGKLSRLIGKEAPEIRQGIHEALEKFGSVVPIRIIDDRALQTAITEKEQATGKKIYSPEDREKLRSELVRESNLHIRFSMEHNPDHKERIARYFGYGSYDFDTPEAIDRRYEAVVRGAFNSVINPEVHQQLETAQLGRASLSSIFAHHGQQKERLSAQPGGRVLRGSGSTANLGVVPPAKGNDDPNDGPTGP